MEEFKQVRKNLLDMLEELDDKLGKITDDSDLDDDPVTNSFVESDVETDSDETESLAEDAMRNDINNIQQAISQIDSGTYGICLACGQPIKKEYLKTVPFSSHCHHCLKDKNGE